MQANFIKILYLVLSFSCIEGFASGDVFKYGKSEYRGYLVSPQNLEIYKRADNYLKIRNYERALDLMKTTESPSTVGYLILIEIAEALDHEGKTGLAFEALYQAKANHPVRQEDLAFAAKVSKLLGKDFERYF